jgi:hypothetical protein
LAADQKPGDSFLSLPNPTLQNNSGAPGNNPIYTSSFQNLFSLNTQPVSDTNAPVSDIGWLLTSS